MQLSKIYKSQSKNTAVKFEGFGFLAVTISPRSDPVTISPSLCMFMILWVIIQHVLAPNCIFSHWHTCINLKTAYDHASEA